MNSCGWVKNLGYNSADRVGNSVDRISKELFPLDSASRRLILGLISGAADEASVRNLEKVSDRLMDTLFAKLAVGLKKLDLDSVARKAIVGVRDEIASDSVQRSINILRVNLERELDALLKGLFKSFSSEESKNNIERAFASILSDNNKQLLVGFVSAAIDSIELDSLGSELRSGVLNDQTRDAFIRTVMAPIDATLSKMQAIVDSLEQQNEKWWEKYFWQLIAGIALLAGILTWLYILRRKSLQNQKALETENTELKKQFKFNEQLNNIMMAEIDQIRQTEAIDQLTNRIKQKAIEHGIEPQVHQKLSQLRMLDRMKWEVK